MYAPPTCRDIVTTRSIFISFLYDLDTQLSVTTIITQAIISWSFWKKTVHAISCLKDNSLTRDDVWLFREQGVLMVVFICSPLDWVAGDTHKSWDELGVDVIFAHGEVLWGNILRSFLVVEMLRISTVPQVSSLLVVKDCMGMVIDVEHIYKQVVVDDHETINIEVAVVSRDSWEIIVFALRLIEVDDDRLIVVIAHY